MYKCSDNQLWQYDKIKNMITGKWRLQNSRHKILLFITPHMECCGYVSCLRIPVDK